MYITLSGCPHIFATLVLLYILLSGSMCLFTWKYKTYNFNISRCSCVSFRIQHKSNENLIFIIVYLQRKILEMCLYVHMYICMCR